MILYNLKTIEPHYRITKFDEDMNPESSYLVSDTACECPQGHKPTCRHRKMLGAMLSIVDSETFYCFDDQTYRDAAGGVAVPKARMNFEDVRDAADEILAKQTESNFRRRV